MSEVWKTKYGPRRVRKDPPTLQEAIAAARGLTDDIQEQVEIAASLMEVPHEQVKAELLRSGGQRKDIRTVGVTTGRPGALRTVVVEHKISRRPGVGKGSVR
jgi:protein involved in polysaccharide export with SLBB domain